MNVGREKKLLVNNNYMVEYMVEARRLDTKCISVCLRRRRALVSVPANTPQTEGRLSDCTASENAQPPDSWTRSVTRRPRFSS